MKLVKIVLCLSLVLSPVMAEACSRAVWTEEGEPVLTGRNMDWTVPMGTKLRLMSRGEKRTGLGGKNSLEWTSKYGSVVATVWDNCTPDGMNEKGLVANLLYLSESNYGERDKTRPGLAISLWAQYYLDNFATVAEAVEATRKINYQIVPIYLLQKDEKMAAPIHISLSDATGDSAIIEMLDGKTVIHHGKEYSVMTNSPPYDEQLVLLKQYAGLGGTKPLPGTSEAEDRFVRLAYYLTKLPEHPADYREAVAGMFSIMRNAATPIGFNNPEKPNISMTLWTCVSDSTDLIYYFEFTTLPNVVWVELKEVDIEEGSAQKVLDLLSLPDLSGNVSWDFSDAASLDFAPGGAEIKQ